MVETKIESGSIDSIQMFSKHLHVCFVTKSHTLWANSSHHSKLVVICLHDVYIVYILCTAGNVLFWQLSTATTWKYIVVTILLLNTTYFVWKKYLPQKKINYSKSAYRLLTTWICIENLFSSCYMPSVDISTIKIRSNTIQAYEKISFWGLETFPYLLKILSKIGNKKPQKKSVFLQISQRCNLDLNGFKKKNV